MSVTYNEEKNRMSEKPDIALLQSELAEIIEDAGRNLQLRSDFDNIRYCRWDGESPDNRKHEEYLGKKPHPWEGASDTKIRVADKHINRHVHMVSEAFFRANLGVTGVEVEDNKKASNWGSLLSYFIEQKMLPELRREVEILAQELFSSSPAIAILGVYWQQETIMRMKRFSIQDLVMMVQEMGGQEQDVEQLLMMLQDPDMTDQALVLMSQVFVGVKEKTLKKGLKQFRETGEAKLPAPIQHENRPRFVAHKLYEDIFVDANCTDLDRSRVIMRREWMSETELRDKINTEEFDEEFVESVLEKAGGASGVADFEYRSSISQHNGISRGVQGDFDDLYEIFYSYKRVYDPDTNVPAIYCTAFSPHVSDLYGKHELLEYGHNQMPFVLFSRERLSRSIMDSRGISEICAPNQYEIKVQRDLRNDQGQISTLPPLLTNARRGALNTLIAPASQITITRPDDIQWLNPPQPSSGSIEAEERANNDANEYFGQSQDQMTNQLYNQCMVNRWLDSWREALSQALCLCQQYLSPEFVSRIVGGAPEEIAVQPDDIQGRYDLSLRFSVDTLNPEFMEKKIASVTQLTQFDTESAIDRNKLVTLMAESIDPQLAKSVVRDPATASQQEIDDEQLSWIKIMAEIEPQPKEGLNFELRSQVAQQLMQSSQELQQKMSEKPLVKQLAENRMKFLQFGIMQKENAQIGRTGIKPIMGQGGQEQSGGEQGAY